MQTLNEQEPTPTLLPTVNGTQQEEQTQAEEQTPIGVHTAATLTAGSRIVSKSEFAGRLGNKTFTSVVALITLISCLISILLTLGLTGAILFGNLRSGAKHESMFAFFGFAVFLGGCSWCLWYFGRKFIKEARQIDPGVPLTRASTADLPAPDSLVRASQEPMQAQEAVLLRAAAGKQEQHEAQLLRAATAEGQK